MRILLFGATGAAGGSVLRACIAAPDVEEIRAIVRRPLGLTHTKLRVIEHPDFLDYNAVRDAFAGADTCLFCLGISVSQVKDETEYRRIIHDFPMAAAKVFREVNPGALFQYISGQGANTGSRMMWARVKAETER